MKTYFNSRIHNAWLTFASNKLSKSLHRIAVAVVLVALAGNPALAATITVTSTGDGGPGTLRAALAAAANGDTIGFAFPTPATITLTNGELVVTNNVTIIGPSPAQLSISGNTNGRVFNIATNRTVSLSGLTIRDGRPSAGANGGGILNAGTLSLSNCMVSFNSAGDPSGSGGGVFNSGVLTAVACTFNGNRGANGSMGGAGGGGLGGGPGSGGPGGNGAGIFNEGSVTLISCTFNANRCGGGGMGGYHLAGGVSASGGPGGSGGAIYNPGTLVCIACTFSGNQAGEGGAGGPVLGFFGGSPGQGGGGGSAGGILNFGTATVRNSILALNTFGPGGPGGYTGFSFGPPGYPGSAPDVSGPVTSQGYNLLGVNGGSTGITNGINGNIVGTTNNPIHPRLGALQDNGGPTWTMSLLTASHALNSGDNTLTGTDQRGFPRLSGSRVDMGACEGVLPTYSRSETLLVGEGFNNAVVAIEVRSGRTVGTFVHMSAGVNYQTFGPRGVLCVSNSLLLVNQNENTPFNGEILTFDINTGVFTGKRVPSSNANAPFAPRGMILGPNNVLYVADVGGFDGVHPGRIARYNSSGGFLGNVVTTGLSVPFYPTALVTGPDGFLYVSGVGDSSTRLNGYIFRFQFNSGTQNYQYLSTLVSSTAANHYSPGLHAPEGIVFGPDGNIYITSFYAVFGDPQGNTVIDRDGIVVFNTSGQRVGSPIYLYPMNADRVFSQAILFGPRGDLFVSLSSDQGLRRYSASSNYEQFTILPTGGASPIQPWYMTFRATNPRTLAYEPPRLAATIAGGQQVNVGWPATYVGWQLQVQTNTLVSSNWVSVPESIRTNNLTFLLNPSSSHRAFYRLVAP